MNVLSCSCHIFLAGKVLLGIPGETLKQDTHRKIIRLILGLILPFRPNSAKARLVDGFKYYLAGLSYNVSCVKSCITLPGLLNKQLELDRFEIINIKHVPYM